MMKKLLLALSSACLISTSPMLLIACGADKANQSVKSDINNFLSGSNKNNKLLLIKSDINKLNNFGISDQEGIYNYHDNNLTVDAVKQGLKLLTNNNQLPLVFIAKQNLLETRGAENETAIFVEPQKCEIVDNNLIYHWNVTLYINKFKNDEFKWVKVNNKSVNLYAEIIDEIVDVPSYIVSEEVNENVTVEKAESEEAVNAEVHSEKSNKEVINTETNNEEANNQTTAEQKPVHTPEENIKVNEQSNKEKNQQIALTYKEKISSWNEDVLMLLENKVSYTAKELICEIRNNASFFVKEIDKEVIETSSIKMKNFNDQIYLEDAALLTAEKFIVEIEFKIGEEADQTIEKAFFEIKISDYADQTSSNQSDFEGIVDDEPILDEEKNDDQSDFKSLDLKESTVSSSIKIETIFVNSKTKVEKVIENLKEKNLVLPDANITLKDSKNNKAKKGSDIKFGTYEVFADKVLVLNLQVEELILTIDSQQLDDEQKAVFHIFNGVQFNKLMANHCLVKDLKEMIKTTDQFKNLKSKIKNILTITIKDKEMNEVEDKTKLEVGKYYIEISFVLNEKNTKALIGFEVNVPNLSSELASQLDSYIAAIENVTARIKTKKEKTEDKLKCEDKIKNSEDIANIFKADSKVVVEHIEILQQTPYEKGKTYRARITFCFKDYELSRKQVEFNFIVE